MLCDEMVQIMLGLLRKGDAKSSNAGRVLQ